MDLKESITTQEQLDAIITPRIKRERETVTKELNERIEASEKKAKDYEKQIADLGKQLEAAGKKDAAIKDLQTKVKGYETASVKTRIAHEAGLPFELAGRLSGEDEDSIRKDAESLVKLIGNNKTIVPPLASTETPGGDGKAAALKALAKSLTNKGE